VGEGQEWRENGASLLGRIGSNQRPPRAQLARTTVIRLVPSTNPHRLSTIIDRTYCDVVGRRRCVG
jgi:hypothetical protein